MEIGPLSRSLKQLIEVINQLHERGIGFKSIQESIDTTTPGGKLIFHVFGALAEFEREVIRERTFAGLHAARTRGRLGGRPKLMNDKKSTARRADGPVLAEHGIQPHQTESFD